VAPTTLPLHYSYGLSVLNSHLVAGAAVLVDGSPDGPGLLAVRRRPRGHVAGWRALPLRDPAPPAVLPAAHPRLRTLTQAGGALRPDLVTEFAALIHEAGGAPVRDVRQTEATARMAVLPPTASASGRGPPGSRSRADPSRSSTGEIVYRGLT